MKCTAYSLKTFDALLFWTRNYVGSVQIQLMLCLTNTAAYCLAAVFVNSKNTLPITSKDDVKTEAANGFVLVAMHVVQWSNAHRYSEQNG